MIFFDVDTEDDKKENKKKGTDRQRIPNVDNKGKEKLFKDDQEYHQQGVSEFLDSMEMKKTSELQPTLPNNTEYPLRESPILTDEVNPPTKKRKRKPKKARTALMSKALANLNKEKLKIGIQRKRMKSQVPIKNVSVNVKKRVGEGRNRKEPNKEGNSTAKISPHPTIETTGSVNRNSWQYMSVGRRANAIKTYVEKYAESNFSLPLESIQRNSVESLTGISKRITEMIYAMEVIRYGLYDDPAVNKADERYRKSLATMQKHAEWIETVGLKKIISCVEKDMPRIEYMKDEIDSFIREMSHHCRDMIDSYPVPPPSRSITTSIFSRQITSRAKGRKKKGKNSTATSRSTILSHNRGRGPTASTLRSGGSSSQPTSSSIKMGPRGNRVEERGIIGGIPGERGNQRSRRRVGLRPTVSEFMRCARSLNECPNILVSTDITDTYK
jgi:hypothetical protein